MQNVRAAFLQQNTPESGLSRENLWQREESMSINWNSRTFSFRINDFFHLFVNTITGAIDIVPERVAFGTMSKDERRALVERGHIGKFENTEEALRRLYEESLRHSENMPYWFYILTTLNCNFSCPICYERKILGRGEIQPEVLEENLRAIKVLQEKWTIPREKMNLVLFGGEPLLVSDPAILRRPLEFARQNGWKCVIITNGSRVPNFLDLFEEFRETISDFRVTLDGPPRIHDSRRPYKNGKGSFSDVVFAIEHLLRNGHQVKMQTVAGTGNIKKLEALAKIIRQKGWPEYQNFQWRIEASHDYANLDGGEDEYSESAIVKELVCILDKYPELLGKLKFESFKYFAHLAGSFGWLGNYKTYWGPKFSFCEPQKGFQYVFSADGRIYHCPRTIGIPNFCLGSAAEGLNGKDKVLKRVPMLKRKKCRECIVNTLCGGGCPVQRKNWPKMDCQFAVFARLHSFVENFCKEILQRAVPDKITHVNELWLPITHPV
jgi:uncharacterized protein